MESVTQSNVMVLPYGMLLTRLYRHVHTTHPYVISDLHDLLDHVMIPLTEGKARRIIIDRKMPHPQTLLESSLSPSPTQNQEENDPVKNYTLDPIVYINQLLPLALVFSTPPNSPIEPHPYLNSLDELPPRSTNAPPFPHTQGINQTLPQHTPMNFKPFFPPINISRRGSRMSAQPVPFMSRDQVVQELGQLHDSSHNLESANQNAQSVQDGLLPPFPSIPSQVPPLPPLFHFTTTSITSILPFRLILLPSNTFVPLD
ncbi:hypothetical protein Tco_0121734 [Tanacetum coccineum]